MTIYQPEMNEQQVKEAADYVMHAVYEFDAHEIGHFTLPGNDHSPENINTERLFSIEAVRSQIGQYLAKLPQLPVTDVIVGVPFGGTRWAEVVHDITNIPIVRMCKLTQQGQGIFTFLSEGDENLAREATSATLIEDVVYRGGAAASVRNLLPSICEVDLRAIWNRRELSVANSGLFRSANFLVTQTLLHYPATDCPDHVDYTE
jgi:orotate phosphoribosyltransferase